jgi:hypothetical protein
MIVAQLRELNDALQNRMIIGPVFPTIESLVLQYGHTFTRQPLPKGRWAKDMGQCYANALRAAKTRRYVYVEGYAISKVASGRAQLHAWVTDPANSTVAFDPTWGSAAEYFGIPFRLEYLLKMHKALGHPGVLDASWEMKWPLASGEHRIEDAIWSPEP